MSAADRTAYSLQNAGWLTNPVPISASGVVHYGPCVLVGMRVEAVGGSGDVCAWANTMDSESRRRLMALQAATGLAVGDVISFCGAGAGVLCLRGLYVQCPSGTRLTAFILPR